MSKTYRPWDPDQGWLLPPSPRDWLDEGDLVKLMNRIVAENPNRFQRSLKIISNTTLLIPRLVL